MIYSEDRKKRSKLGILAATGILTSSLVGAAHNADIKRTSAERLLELDRQYSELKRDRYTTTWDGRVSNEPRIKADLDRIDQERRRLRTNW